MRALLSTSDLRARGFCHFSYFSMGGLFILNVYNSYFLPGDVKANERKIKFKPTDEMTRIIFSVVAKKRHAFRWDINSGVKAQPKKQQQKNNIRTDLNRIKRQFALWECQAPCMKSHATHCAGKNCLTESCGISITYFFFWHNSLALRQLFHYSTFYNFFVRPIVCGFIFQLCHFCLRSTLAFGAMNAQTYFFFFINSYLRYTAVRHGTTSLMICNENAKRSQFTHISQQMVRVHNEQAAGLKLFCQLTPPPPCSSHHARRHGRFEWKRHFAFAAQKKNSFHLSKLLMRKNVRIWTCQRTIEFSALPLFSCSLRFECVTWIN